MRATLSASRVVTRAWGSSQSKASNFGPQVGQATPARQTTSTVSASKTGRSRISRWDQSCTPETLHWQPLQALA